MHGQVLTVLHKIRLRFFIVPVVILADLFLLSLLPAVITVATPAAKAQQAAVAAASDASFYESPNAITVGAANFAEGTKRGLIGVGQLSRTILRTMGTAAALSAKWILYSVTRSVLFVLRTVGTCLIFVAKVAASCAAFLVRVPGYLLGFASSTATASPITRPSNNNQVPVINPNSPAILAARASLPALQPSPQPAPVPAPTNTAAAIWPIHGHITTPFGVPHWPYQPTHSGVDISSGKPSGVMPVVPFKPGVVAEAVHSYSGLGNRVVVDHGGGIVSVYGHLASISVQAGQSVRQDSVLGYEGSTGASTGTHLHLEIRANGQTVDPRQFISGQP